MPSGPPSPCGFPGRFSEKVGACQRKKRVAGSWSGPVWVASEGLRGCVSKRSSFSRAPKRKPFGWSRMPLENGIPTRGFPLIWASPHEPGMILREQLQKDAKREKEPMGGSCDVSNLKSKIHHPSKTSIISKWAKRRCQNHPKLDM